MASNPKDTAIARQLLRDNQANHILVLAQGLHGLVGDLIETRMPHLTKTTREKLFSGYGPSASFAIRIDIAHAMGLITSNLKRDLHGIRDVRNKFAHPGLDTHFDDDAVQEAFSKFEGYRKGKDQPFGFYVERSGRCLRALISSLQPTAKPSTLAALLMEAGEKASQKKSS